MQTKNFFSPIKKLTLKEVIKLTEAVLVGRNILDTALETIEIEGIATLASAKSTEISFLGNHLYKDDFLKTKAGFCFISQEYTKDAPEHLVLLVVKSPYIALAQLLTIYYPYHNTEIAYISEKANISKLAKLGKNVHIKENVVIGDNVEIGDNVVIYPNTIIYENVKIASNTIIYSSVSIKYAIIGSNCIIHDGVRIGQDGFGFAFHLDGHLKVPQIGGVIIGDNVEIGSNTCIDRGALENTEIGDGTKIDNLVQIAHNVKIGKHCFLAAQVGIAGSAVIGNYVGLGGKVGVVPHISITDGTQVAPMSGIAFSIDKKEILMGIPARNFREFWKLQALFNRLLKKRD